MPVKSLEELREGMITKEPVFDEAGNVVLREGVELTGKIIAALRQRGVSGVFVDTDEIADAHDKKQAERFGLTEGEKIRLCRQLDDKVNRIFAGHKDKRMLEMAEAAKRYHKAKIR
jgi:hypothetical protein